ncbi:MAG TPA: HNH endonuclease [Caulobacteraceae bacterium]
MPPAEEWRVCPDYEAYEVSSLGRVRRRWGRAETIAQKLEPTGYFSVHLCMHGVRCTRFVHRLVCRAWHGPPPTPEHQSDHFPDKTTTNNVPENLRWATRAENLSTRVLPCGENHWRARRRAYATS